MVPYGAEQGRADAQYQLGLMLYKGTGCVKDLIQAHMWLNLAATKYKGEVLEMTERLLESTEDKMTSEQIGTAQKLTKEWMDKHKNMEAK